MKFLNLDECEAWSGVHGYGLRDRLPLPEVRGVVRVTVRTPKEGAPSRAVAASLQKALGDWDEMLVWAAETWVYNHSQELFSIEDLRALAEEERPAKELPGQLLVRGEELALRRILVVAVDQPWYAYFFPGMVDGRVPLRWARTTWDNYVRVTSSEPDGVAQFAEEMRQVGLTPTIAIKTEEGEWVELDATGA